jgi:hypothetical protein
LAGNENATHPEKGLAETRREMERYLNEENVEVKAAVTIVISDGQFNYKRCVDNDTWLRQYGPVFYVFISENEGQMNGPVQEMQKVLKEAHKGISCKHCVVSFAPKMGQGNSVTEFAGGLMDMCQANAGEAVECGSYNE